MSFWDNVKKLAQPYADDEYDDYDDELEEYCCDVNLDEDEMVRFLTSSNYQCPYYRLYDEYGIVKKQN